MRRSLVMLWKVAEGQRARYAAAVAALVLASCFLYLAPLVAQVTIDGVLAAAPAPDGTTGAGFAAEVVARAGGAAFLRERLWIPALVIVGLTALAGVFTYLRGRWAARASEGIVRRVRDGVYDHLQRLPCTYFDRSETGDLIQRCTSDVETLRVFLANQVVEVGRAAIMLTVPIPFMLAIDVRMTIASLVLIPVIVAFAIGFFVRIRRVFLLVDEAEGRLTTSIQENITGIRVVRAFARQAYECERFDARNREHRDLDKRLYRLLAWYWSCSDLLCHVQRFLVLALGAWLLVQEQLAVGAFFYFLTAVGMFIWPVRMMGRILADLGKATVALGRLGEILEEPMESAPTAPVAPAALEGAIEFENVSFGHDPALPVLRDVSFRVEPGETLAIVGPSGSGKTTIVNLLLRLYDHDAGTIRIDGHDLARLDRSFVRRQIAVVMQQPFLYSRSLRDNLRIARPTAADDEVVEAAAIACVHDSIAAFEQGYDTVVGERGVTLSGGQRQRVAIARALLQDPAVLVLDDALSAVDADTEGAILDALASRHGHRTTIVIAHRLGTLMHADHVIVLDRGRIAERGRHRDLVRANGLYARLWRIQGEVEEDDRAALAERGAREDRS